MENMRKIINNKILEIKNTIIDYDSLNFLNMFTPNVSSLKENDFIDIITCFYMVLLDTSLSDALTEINKVRPFLEDMLDLDYDEILSLVDVFYDLEVKFGERLGSYTYDDYITITSDDEVLTDTKDLLKEYLTKLSKKEINNFLNWMNDDILSDIICFASALRGIKSNLDQAIVEADGLEMPEFFKSKENRRISSGYITEVKGSYLKTMEEELKEDIEKLKIYKDHKNHEIASLKRNMNKKIRDLEYLLQSLNNKTLTLDELLKLNIDEEVLYYALIELVKIKNEEYSNNYQMLENYRKNPVNKLEKIFHEYNYNFNLLTKDEQNVLMSLSDLEKIRENLSFFSTTSLNFLSEKDEVFVKLLITDMEILMQIDSLLFRDKIDSDFVRKYGSLFNDLTTKILVRNVNKLDMQKVNFNTLLEYNDKILLDLNTKLFDCLVAYGVDLKNPNLNHYAFLEDSKLLNLIDEFIEIGLLKQIQSLPNLISSKSKIVIKRNILMQDLAKDYLNERGTLNQVVRSGKDFLLSDDDIDKYTYQNYSIFMNEDMLNVLNNKDSVEILTDIPDDIAFIESFKKNEQVYLIGGNYYSRIKVLRYLKTLIDEGFNDYKEMLFNVLIYNYPRNLDVEEIEELKNINKNIKRKQLI